MGLKLAALMASIMIALGGVGYWYYTDTQKKLAILHENNAKLETATKIQTETINKMQADVKLASQLAVEAQKELQVARQQIESVRNKFNKQSKLLGNRDIGKLATHKPKPIKKIIDKGTKNVLRCFEILSGQPLTEKEQNAEKKSQLNNSCPSVANPNRRMQ